MYLISILAAIVIIFAVLAAIWWYYPYVRKTWAPSFRAEESARTLCEDAELPFPLERPRILVSKAARELTLYDGETPVKTYRIALGTNPVEDKRKEGDGCTPEGEFYVCTKNDRSRFHLFLGLSYPNAEDAERGLRTRLISGNEHKAIVRAIENKTRPPWNTRLGGEIGIHGNGADSDWTLGCIAVSDTDIEELFTLVDIGTPVVIEHE